MMLANNTISVKLPDMQVITVIGFITVISVGVTTCILLVLAMLWLVVHLALFTLQSMIETLSVIGSTYTASDPLVKFFILIALSYVLYRVYCKVTRKVTR